MSRHTLSEWGTVREPPRWGFPHMLVGYMRVSTEGDRQVLDLQRDALLAAGVDERHLFEDRASGSRNDRADLGKALAFIRASIGCTYSARHAALSRATMPSDRRAASRRVSAACSVSSACWRASLSSFVSSAIATSDAA